MLEFKFFPRFRDTDALGHINNANIPTWFEEGRRPLFKYFIPDLNPKKWNLIIARIEIDFLAQASFQDEVVVQTSIEKIGTSSMVLLQEAFQNDSKVASGKSVMIHFDYKENKSLPIPAHIKTKLQTHVHENKNK